MGEAGVLRGAEAALEEHWCWVTAARILKLNGTSTFYLPRDWTWLLSFLCFLSRFSCIALFFFFQAEDGIRDLYVTGVQKCALPIFDADGRYLAREAPELAAAGLHVAGV